MKKVNIIFISPETLTSYFDVALNKRIAGQGAVSRIWLFSVQRFNVSDCQKIISETKCYLSTTIECLTYLSTLTSA